MDSFKDSLFIVYLMKMLKDIGKHHVAKAVWEYPVSQDGETDYDTYNEAALYAIDSIFLQTKAYYNEDNGICTYVLADPVITDYYRFAGDYGKQKGYNDNNNPFFIEARQTAGEWFRFSYSIGWILKPCTEPKYPNQSKFVILVDEYEHCDIIGIAIGIAAMYDFFSKKCDELTGLWADKPDGKGEAAA